MELPITKPSKVSYADELDFSKLLEELLKTKFNGYVRVTTDSEEGYILFKDGNKVAAAYERESKLDAVEKIKMTMDNDNTLIEVFDIRSSQIDFLMDINKVYLIESTSEIDRIVEELKRPDHKPQARFEPKDPKNSRKSEPIPKTVPEMDFKPKDPKTGFKNEEYEATEHANDMEDIYDVHAKSEDTEIKTSLSQEPEIEVETEIKNANEVIKPELNFENKSMSNINEINLESDYINDLKPEIKNDDEFALEDEPVDRMELMKKYGLKDADEEEVDTLLETYKGGSVNEDDVEKIELTLMNKIKRSILGIPKIKGTEVMVFLDNTYELAGTVNVITEYESKGFLSRIMGESKDINNLKNQIINITQMEIKKSFRGYPEIVDSFDISVDIH